MKLIKQYDPPYNLKKFELDGGDFDYFVNEFKIYFMIVRRLCEYLDKNEKTVIIDQVYNAGSGIFGFHFIVDNVDLSRNGFEFTQKELAKYLHKKGY